MKNIMDIFEKILPKLFLSANYFLYILLVFTLF